MLGRDRVGANLCLLVFDPSMRMKVAATVNEKWSSNHLGWMVLQESSLQFLEYFPI